MVAFSAVEPLTCQQVIPAFRLKFSLAGFYMVAYSAVEPLTCQQVIPKFRLKFSDGSAGFNFSDVTLVQEDGRCCG